MMLGLVFFFGCILIWKQHNQNLAAARRDEQMEAIIGDLHYLSRQQNTQIQALTCITGHQDEWFSTLGQISTDEISATTLTPKDQALIQKFNKLNDQLSKDAIIKECISNGTTAHH